MKLVLSRQEVVEEILQAPLEEPIYSGVEKCPIDAFMHEEKDIQRWMAVVLLLMRKGFTARAIGIRLNKSKRLVLEVLKGELVDSAVMDFVAQQLELPVEQVFCYGDAS